jgi:quercetin dioxygenase-like cupin family protein
MNESIKIKTVLQSSKSWNGALLPLMSGIPEFHVLHFSMKPGAKTTIHMHPLHGAGYMIAGELTMYATDDPHGSFEEKSKVKKIVLKTGDAWNETVNIWHYGVNETANDVEFVLIFVGHEMTPPTLSLGTHPK